MNKGISDVFVKYYPVIPPTATNYENANFKHLRLQSRSITLVSIDIWVHFQNLHII